MAVAQASPDYDSYILLIEQIIRRAVSNTFPGRQCCPVLFATVNYQNTF